MIAGKPHPGIVDAARQDRPGPVLMVGDGLATDIECANRTGVDSLLVLTGVTTVRDLLAAPPSRRPSYVAADLRGLLVPHPPVRLDSSGFHCGGWTATVRGEEVALSRPDPRADPVDGLRALCRAVWAARDAATVAPTPAPPPLPISLEDLEEFCTL